MTKANKLTREDIIKWATSRHWVLDNYGHLQKAVNGKLYRLKLSKIAVRNEFKVDFEHGPSEWVRLSSAYYKDLSINEDDKLTGMKK